jgi:hypothetical protein
MPEKRLLEIRPMLKADTPFPCKFCGKDSSDIAEIDWGHKNMWGKSSWDGFAAACLKCAERIARAAGRRKKRMESKCT